jgi:hypothetical protein
MHFAAISAVQTVATPTRCANKLETMYLHQLSAQALNKLETWELFTKQTETEADVAQTVGCLRRIGRDTCQ